MFGVDDLRNVFVIHGGGPNVVLAIQRQNRNIRLRPRLRELHIAELPQIPKTSQIVEMLVVRGKQDFPGAGELGMKRDDFPRGLVFRDEIVKELRHLPKILFELDRVRMIAQPSIAPGVLHQVFRVRTDHRPIDRDALHRFR
jgi:hypothetical protein